MRHAGAVGPCQDSTEGEGEGEGRVRPEVRPQNPRETRPSRAARSGRQGAPESTAAGRSWCLRGGEGTPVTVGDPPYRRRPWAVEPRCTRGEPLKTPDSNRGGGRGGDSAHLCGCGGRVCVFCSLGCAEGPCAERPKPPVLARTRRRLPCPALLRDSGARSRTLAQWALRRWRGLLPALPAVGSRWGGVFLACARPTPLFPVPGTPGSSLLARLMRRLAPTYFGFILPFPSFSTWTYLTGFISNFTLSAVFLLLCRGRSVF